MIIENFGVGKRCSEALCLLVSAEAAGELPTEFKRTLLLPIPTSKDKIHLSGTDKLASEVYGEAKAGDFVAGYGIERAAREAMTERGALVYDALLDEEFLADNAEATALGALGYILSNSDKTVRDSSFAVVGYGRIGKAMVRLLLFLGAKVRVYSGREEVCIELGECGVEAYFLDTGYILPKTDADFIINTAPTDLSPSFPDGRLPRGVRVIELASGENFRGIEGVERLPSIPDRFYGKSAGKTYFSYIVKRMKEAVK
jgi:hypothetical protein